MQDSSPEPGGIRMSSNATLKKETTDPADLYEKVRVTYLIPKVLDMNVEVFSAIEGLQKNEFVALAIGECLRLHGVDPQKPPKENYLKPQRKD